MLQAPAENRKLQSLCIIIGQHIIQFILAGLRICGVLIIINVISPVKYSDC